MPELPEVETVCRGLERVMTGRTVTRLIVRRPDLRFPLPKGLAQSVAGRQVEGVRRRAKYWILSLSGGISLIGHLGMSGRMTFRGEGDAAGAHDHLEWVLDDGTHVVLNDPRRFGMVDLSPTDALDSHRWLAALGPEPLGNQFNGPLLSAAIAGRRAPIKGLLLDQRIVAGLGNIYVCEALFEAGISPRRSGMSVAGRRAERLVTSVRAVLERAIAAGGSSLRDYVQTDGSLGYFQHSFKVYGREGAACDGCHCDLARTGGVQRLVQSGRSTFFCPRRQR